MINCSRNTCIWRYQSSQQTRSNSKIENSSSVHITKMRKNLYSVTSQQLK